MYVHVWVCLPARLRVPAWGEVAPRYNVNRLNKFLSKIQPVFLYKPLQALSTLIMHVNIPRSGYTYAREPLRRL